MIGIVFSKDLDFLSKLLVVLTMCSIIFMFVYLVLPMSGRRGLERLDFNKEVGGSYSWSGLFASCLMIVLGITKMQKTQYYISSDEKMHEGAMEREFRLRE